MLGMVRKQFSTLLWMKERECKGKRERVIERERERALD